MFTASFLPHALAPVGKGCVLLLMGLILGTMTGQAQPDAAPSAVAFTHVAVLPMTAPQQQTQQVLHDQTVLVQHGRIQALGPAADLAIPEGTQIVEGRGRFLLPGLFDMHTHLLSDDRIPDAYAPHELLLMLGNGVTSARIPIGKPQHLSHKKQVARGALLGPHLYVASPQLAGRSFGSIFNGYAVATPQEARVAVREAHEAGYEALKVTFFIRRPVYDAIVEVADSVGLPVIGHVGPQVGLDRALEAGQHIEHLDQFLEALLPEDAPVAGCVSGVGIWNRDYWPCLRYIEHERIPALARRVADANLYNTPTLYFLKSSFGTGRSDEEIAASPDLRFVSDALRDELLSGHAHFWKNPPPETLRQQYEAIRDSITLALYAAGAPIMAGSDAPEWLLLPGFSIHRELKALVEAGLPPYAALAAATRVPATYLGVLDQTGTIEPGKRADLLLLEANPLDDITNTQRIAGVMALGWWLDREDLDALLDQTARALSAAPMRGEPEPQP